MDKWEASHFGKETVEPEDRKTLARFAREWVQDHMNEVNGSNILIFLEELKFSVIRKVLFQLKIPPLVHYWKIICMTLSIMNIFPIYLLTQ